jgi:phosphoribosylglycinamide formyltransferase-1
MNQQRVLFIVSGKGECNALKAGIFLGKKYGFSIAVVSHQYDTKAYEVALAEGVSFVKVSGNREGAWQNELMNCIVEFDPSMVFLMYNRIIPSEILQKISCPVVNIHPSILPAFKGFLSVDQALGYKVKFTGVTAHLVDESIDGGLPIIQTIIPIHKNIKKYCDLRPILNEHYCRIVYTLLTWLTEQENVSIDMLVEKIINDFELHNGSIWDMYPDPYHDRIKHLPIFR